MLKTLAWFAFTFYIAGLAIAQRNPVPGAPGELIDLGGYKVQINCNGHGGPAIILLHGFGDYSFDWALVQPKLAAQTTTCSYDRPGQAWSDPGPAPRGLATSANELHTVLDRAGIKPPYVLVGHSWGGLIARMYAHQYRKEVAGLVLVDSAHEDEYVWLDGNIIRPRFFTDQQWADLMAPKPEPPPKPLGTTDSKPAAPLMVRKTITLDPPFDKLPPEAQKLQLWAMSLPFSKARIEGGDFTDMRQDFLAMYKIRSASEHPLDSLPLIVISKSPELDNDDDYKPEQLAWNRALQAGLATLSTNSKQIVAQHSGHHIQLDQPDLVISAVLRIVDSVRHRRPLTDRKRPR